jgi:hypothetical protein
MRRIALVVYMGVITLFDTIKKATYRFTGVLALTSLSVQLKSNASF